MFNPFKQNQLEGDLINQDVKRIPDQVKSAQNAEKKSISRRKFLKNLGIGVAMVATGSVLNSFDKQDKKLAQEKTAEKHLNNHEIPETGLDDPEEEVDNDPSIVKKNMKINI